MTWRIGYLSIRRSVPLIVLAVVCVSCSSITSGGDVASSPNQQPGVYEGMDQETLGAYHARFELQFEGRSSWLYHLETRVTAEARERSLQIEGVSDARNPGDVRMVTRSQESRMRGPGTDDQCLRFPQSMGMNITYLSPDDVMPPSEFSEPLVPLGDERIAGRQSLHYALVQKELGGWQEVRLGIWKEEGSNALLRYDLNAQGFDPYFGAGFGMISGRYMVLEIGPQSIDPIDGCEIELPLPAHTDGLVRLQGVVAFETNLSLEETVSFYRDALQGAGWQPLTEEERGSGAIVISYRRGAERLDVTIRAMEDSTRVELLTEE